MSKAPEAAEMAEALALHANALLQAGEIGSAQKDLDEAAAIHASAGRTRDEARCLQMAGTLCRFQGALDEAARRVSRALEIAGDDSGIRAPAHAELGEIALARSRGVEAAAEFLAAAEASERAGLPVSARAGYLRKRAAALTMAKQYTEAIDSLETACNLLLEAGDRSGAARALIEQATAMQHARRFTEAEPVIQRAMALAAPAGDHAAMADIHLLLATQALERRDPQAALASARNARTEALAGNAPSSYIAAAYAIAQLSETAGDRLGAYEALAVGWATVADLPHQSLARAAFEPRLKEMRERWGALVFDEVKKAYEAGRRKALRL